MTEDHQCAALTSFIEESYLAMFWHKQFFWISDWEELIYGTSVGFPSRMAFFFLMPMNACYSLLNTEKIFPGTEDNPEKKV